MLATGPRRLLGRADGTLPWHAPADLAHFRAVTAGHHLIVGRRTAQTLPALPGRHLVVVTRDPASLRGTPAGDAPSTRYADSPAAALVLARDADPAAVLAGGGQLYAELWDQITTLWWTRIDTPAVEDDTVRAGDVVLDEACTTAGFELAETGTPGPGVEISRYERS